MIARSVLASLILLAAAQSAQAYQSVSISPFSVQFFDTRVGTWSFSETLWVRNTGDEDLNFFRVDLEGFDRFQFDLTQFCPFILTRGSSCTVTVRYAPRSVGRHFAEVVASGGTYARDRARLSGNAVPN
jgi:hypothetical protein